MMENLENNETRKWILIAVGLMSIALIVLIIVAWVNYLQPGKPIIKINSPASGGQVNEGQELIVSSTATDDSGIVRIELLVDNGLARIDTVPVPQKVYNLEQPWKAVRGQHVLSVRAFNKNGLSSDPAIITVQVAANATPMPVPTTFAPTPTPTTGAACVNKATWVADVTIPAGSTVPAGQSFNKIWRVQNTGNCTWNNKFQLVYVGGEPMAVTQMISVGDIAPNATTDLLIAMTAPTAVGTHAAQWQIRDDRGIFFSPLLEVRINVPGPTPTQTPVPAFLVTAANASVNPPQYTGACPGTFTLNATITTNRAGAVAYRWTIPGMNPSDALVFNAPQAGTFNLPGYLVGVNNKGNLWGQLQVISPNPIASQQALFSNNCSDPRPAPPQAAIVAPGNGFTGQVGQPIQITFQGIGNTELSSVSLFANNVLLAKQVSRNPTQQIQAVYGWLPNIAGTYELWAVAVDIFGQQTTSPHVTGFIYAPAPPPTSTPVPPPPPPTWTPVPPPTWTPVPQPTPLPQRRNINGNWSAGEWSVELTEAIGCSASECGISGTLTHGVLPAPEVNQVCGTFNLYTGAVSFAVEIPGGRTFTGTVSVDSRTMSGTLSGAGSITFTK